MVPHLYHICGNCGTFVLKYHTLWYISGIHKNLIKYENMKMYVSNNPNGAMRSIMYVLDDFAGFGSFLVLFARIFKNGVEN